MIDFDFDIPEFDFKFDEKRSKIHKNNLEDEREQRAKASALKTKNKHLYRRFTSERTLEATLDWHFADGECHHMVSMGDIDSLTYLKLILRQQPLEYCLLSTWCMALADIEELGRWLDKGLIKRLDCYVGEIFKGSYAKEYDALCQLMKKHGGRACIFRNHSKIFAGFGSQFSFAVESSANINTNPRTENTVITVGREIADFYKEFFDGIKSFERNFDYWQPYRFGESG